ncbi:uncharacterized protein LOC127848363 [Dreissena polymorpha]|uniref:uncharacterized protein LOC127848363 n=1 Tax=Dreissena polymorpha TaxID=45954 RepID=UPI00226424C4|nr:uncharacterized protein LOC127848363 [Dreissena polymorpha]
MASASTPVKVVRHCFTCNSQTKGRLRNINNVAMRNISFKSHFEVLGCDLEEVNTSKFVMCESCLKTLDKVSSMKSVLKTNLNDCKSVHERQKRMILHSISPTVKRFVQNRLTPIKPRKSVKQLFSANHPESDKECYRKTSTLKLDLPIPPDHLYSAAPTTTSHAEHTYSVKELKDKPNSEENVSVYFLHKKKLLSPLPITQEAKEILQETTENMINGKTSAEEMLAAIVEIPVILERLWQIILMKLSFEMDQLCRKTEPSVLRLKVGDIKPQTFCHQILFEMHQRCPRALDFLMTMACPVHLAMPEDSRIIAGMYAMAMYARNNQLIGFQKCMAASCIRYNAGNGLLGLLHTFGLSIPEKTKLVMLDDLGKINGREVTTVLNQGKTLKITVDNIDGRIKANQIRYGSSNRDYHYTHWSVIIDRFDPRDLEGLGTQPKVVPAKGPDATTFFLSKEEKTSLRNCYSWMVKRILVEDVPALSAFSSVVPTVLNHQYRKVVDRPTEVYPMFKIFKTFYKTETAREAGSLANYRAVLHRTNVNGDVKANGYEAHKDFLITVTRALLKELTCESLRLEKPDDIQEMLPTDLQEMTASNKRRWFEKKVSPVVDKIVGTSSAPPAPDMNVTIKHKGTLYHVAISAENAGKTIQLKLNGDIIQINVPAQKENVQEEVEDDVQE